MYNYIKLYIKHFFPGRFESGLSYKYSVTGVFYQFEIIIFPLFFYIKKGKHVNICMLSKFLSINFAWFAFVRARDAGFIPPSFRGCSIVWEARARWYVSLFHGALIGSCAFGRGWPYYPHDPFDLLNTAFLLLVDAVVDVFVAIFTWKPAVYRK